MKRSLKSEPPAYYDAWIKHFAEAREMALSLQRRGYYIAEPDGGFPTIDTIRQACTAEQWSALQQHALCLACLDGNAFPDLVEQYIPEAWANLEANGCVSNGVFPCLLSYT